MAKDIFERQRVLGSGYDVTKVGDDQDTLHLYKTERLAFLCRFHEYAKECPMGEPLNWSQWCEKHGIDDREVT